MTIAGIALHSIFRARNCFLSCNTFSSPLLLLTLLGINALVFNIPDLDMFAVSCQNPWEWLILSLASRPGPPLRLACSFAWRNEIILVRFLRRVKSRKMLRRHSRQGRPNPAVRNANPGTAAAQRVFDDRVCCRGLRCFVLGIYSAACIPAMQTEQGHLLSLLSADTTASKPGPQICLSSFLIDDPGCDICDRGAANSVRAG